MAPATAAAAAGSRGAAAVRAAGGALPPGRRAAVLHDEGGDQGGRVLKGFLFHGSSSSFLTTESSPVSLEVLFPTRNKRLPNMTSISVLCPCGPCPERLCLTLRRRNLQGSSVQCGLNTGCVKIFINSEEMLMRKQGGDRLDLV